MSQPIDLEQARRQLERDDSGGWAVLWGDDLIAELEAARAEIDRLKKERADIDQSMDILLRHCGI